MFQFVSSSQQSNITKRTNGSVTFFVTYILSDGDENCVGDSGYDDYDIMEFETPPFLSLPVLILSCLDYNVCNFIWFLLRELPGGRVQLSLIVLLQSGISQGLLFYCK